MRKIDRFDKYMSEMGLNDNKVTIALKLSIGTLGKSRKAGRDLSDRVIEKILNYYRNLNKVWLLTGEGEMLNNNDDSESEDIDIIDCEDAAGRKGLIPFYDAETSSGYTGHVASSTTTVNLVGYIESGGWFGESKVDGALRNIGDSMLEYPNGCILALRQVLNRKLLVPGKNYVIETSEYRVTKRVQKGSSPDCIALYSSNEETYADGRLIYEPFEVYFEDIRRIFSILGYVVNESGECHIIREL